MANTPTQKGQRLAQLDALRGIAACMVVVYHFTQNLATFRGHPMPGWMDVRLGSLPLLQWLWPFNLGEHGVALFFVISGFVIFMTLERTQHGLDFVASRFARLFPAFWVCLGLTALVQVFSGDALRPWEYLANLSMLGGYLGAEYVDGVYWTLEVELHFYLLMLIVYLAGVLRHIDVLCLGWVAFSGVVGVAGRVTALQPAAEVLNPLLLLAHAPLFAMGIMFYRIYTQRVTLLRVGVIALSLAAVVIGMAPAKALIVGITCLLLVGLVAGRIDALGKSKTLLFLGAISYPLYLLHLYLGVRLIDLLLLWTTNPLVLVLVPAATCVLLAALVHLLIEEPSRERFRAWYARVREARAARKALAAKAPAGAAL